MYLLSKLTIHVNIITLHYSIFCKVTTKYLNFESYCLNRHLKTENIRRINIGLCLHRICPTRIPYTCISVCFTGWGYTNPNCYNVGHSSEMLTVFMLLWATNLCWQN